MSMSWRFILVSLGLAMHIAQIRTSFVPVLDADGKSIMCALDPPTAVFPVADVSVGIPMEVPGDVICGFVCAGYLGCISFNHRQPQQTSPRCEIYTYVPTNCSSVMQPDGICNHYEITDSSSSCRPLAKQLRPSLTYVLSGNGLASAVTSLNDQLFVARTPNVANQILVYNTNTSKLLGNITIPGTSSTFWGLAACPVYNCLYISDWNNLVVHRVNLSSAIFTRPTMTNWTVCSGPAGLSVNSRHNLMVTCTTGQVREYTTNGSLVRQLQSDSATWHSVEVNNATYAISRYYSKSQVCLLAVNSTVLNCYANGTAGSGLEQLNRPMGMAVDTQGYIVVADSLNNRILVLDPTLSNGRLLQLPINNTGTISEPIGLWLDETRGRLYVAEDAGKGRVLAFDNVFNLFEAFMP